MKCQVGRSSVSFLEARRRRSPRQSCYSGRVGPAVPALFDEPSYTDVLRFIGLANYYRKFVRHFFTLAATLTALCSQGASSAWGDAERAQGRSHVSAGAARMGPCSGPSRPTHLLTDISELAVSVIQVDPRAARRHQRVSPSDIRIAYTDPAGTIVLVLYCSARAASSGTRAEDAASLSARQANLSSLKWKTRACNCCCTSITPTASHHQRGGPICSPSTSTVAYTPQAEPIQPTS